MKGRPVLIFAIAATITVELILIILVFDEIGGERLPIQLGRLILLLLLVYFVLNNKSKFALFLLTVYHIVTGVIFLYSNNSVELLDKIFAVYHIGIGQLIYFHSWIEDKIGIRK